MKNNIRKMSRLLFFLSLVFATFSSVQDLKAEQIVASVCHVNTDDDVLDGEPASDGSGTGPHPRSFRGSARGFNRTGAGRACTEKILFVGGHTYEIGLHDTIHFTNNNDTNTDGDNFNLIVDGAGATVIIDATSIQDEDPNKCAIDLMNSESIWRNMTIRVRNAEKAFCDHGNNNVHVNGQNGLIIQVVSNGNNNNPPQEECNDSDPCCNNNHWRPAGEACTAPGVVDGHCNAQHLCIGTVTPPQDSDNDGDPDTADNCPQISNADQADGDNDGVGNVCDNCPEVANPTQTDGDSDGTGDACEIATPPTNSDSDSIPDASDNCPHVANQNQADQDHDGTGDACDNDRDGDGLPNAQDPNPNNPNVDGDDLLDGVDDCPEEAGPSENQGCPLETPPPPADSDGDGVANDQDQCPSQAGVSSNHGCPVTNQEEAKEEDNNAQPNTSNSTCSGNVYTMNVQINGETKQKTICSSGGGCSLGGALIANKGHYFMALLSLGLFVGLACQRRRLQKNSNK